VIQVAVSSKVSSPLRASAYKPAATLASNVDKAVGKDAAAAVQVSVAAADVVQQPSLYQIIRQRSLLKLNTDEQHSSAGSCDDDSALKRSSDVQHSQRESAVKFCLENNAFISASSAEESQCR